MSLPKLKLENQVYRTKNGVQLVGDSRQLLKLLPSASVALIVTSPPFALQRKKSYGNKDQAEYVQWLCEFGAAALRTLKDTGSLVLVIRKGQTGSLAV